MQKIFVIFRGLPIAFIALVLSLQAQAQIRNKDIKFSWNLEKNVKLRGEVRNRLLVSGLTFFNNELTPVYRQSFSISGTKNCTVRIEHAIYSPVTEGLLNPASIRESEPTIELAYTTERKQPKAIVSIVPFRRVNGQVQRLESFDLVITSTADATPVRTFNKAGTTTSVLASGNWYRIYVNQTGIHRINKAFLKQLGLDIENLDPRSIRLYGNGPGMLPMANNAFRFDDLIENPIVVEGESDGHFDEGDALIFYGKSQQDVWRYDTATKTYNHDLNVYSDATVYFITYGNGNGKRLNTAPVLSENYIANGQYDYLQVHEKELSNILKTGRKWVGEEFNREPDQYFAVNLDNAVLTQPVFIRSSVVARAFSASSFTIRAGNNVVMTTSLTPASTDFERNYATETIQESNFTPPGNVFSMHYTYNQPAPGTIGWLDYFELQSRNYLTMNHGQLLVRDKYSIAPGRITRFAVASNHNGQVWDVTRPWEPVLVTSSYNGDSIRFVAATDSLKEFVVYDKTEYANATMDAKISNQNIHGLPFADLFIVSYDAYMSEANRIAEVRRKEGLTVNVVALSQVYNEFSSGMQDLAAIRDMMRHFYKRASNASEMPKYLLLFGRASYDYKSRISNNTNRIPTFESWESFWAADWGQPSGASYCSDDFFGLLDDAEGNMSYNETLDIGIGRIPATTPENATIMADKIIKYKEQPDHGDWKNRLTFVADDEDGNIHENQADNLSEPVRNTCVNFNVQKVYIDAFREETSAGGARNPDAQGEIVRAVERGCMLVNYNGHGGEVGWAAERILNTDDIQGWTNGMKLPLFFTATCEFSRFDDPARFSAGEYVLLNGNGGGIALMTTVRLVDAGNNYSLNNAFFKYAGFDSASAFNRMRLGEIMRKTKNDVLTDNSRNFTLLGDPSMMLAYPEKRVITTTVNNIPISGTTDTLKAYSYITIAGKITDLTGNFDPTFNGIIYPTVFDKAATYATVVNNPDVSNPMNFSMQNNVIYRGSATVTNGNFSFSFIVPKDINYQYGFGKISYYADNGPTDAHGNDFRITVGGTADSSGVDKDGPVILLYLNDEHFVNGGLTNDKPLFIAKLKDFSGINITGVGIGRELSLTTNNDNTTTTSMNDFYRARTDSYQEGEVKYTMKNIPLGKNTLKFGAWDVYNNYNEASLDFVVAGSADMALRHVLNYPNPFTTNTTFHFDHNKSGQKLKVMVQIYTVSGKLIKTLQTETQTAASHFADLSWDGKDEFGDGIGKGVYVYKVKVQPENGKSAEEFQKLVILN